MPAPIPLDELANRIAAAMQPMAEAFRNLGATLSRHLDQPGNRDMLRYVGEAMGRAADDLDARLAMAHGEWRPPDELAWQPFTADELEARVVRAHAEGRVRAGRVWSTGLPSGAVAAAYDIPPGMLAEAAEARWDELTADEQRALDERDIDILDRIDDATLCGYCGGVLAGWTDSTEFCGPRCQAHWYSTQVEPLRGYVEPWGNWAAQAPYADDELANTQRTGDLRDERGHGSTVQPF